MNVVELHPQLTKRELYLVVQTLPFFALCSLLSEEDERGVKLYIEDGGEIKFGYGYTLPHYLLEPLARKWCYLSDLYDMASELFYGTVENNEYEEIADWI